jgi:hypothetical protein
MFRKLVCAMFVMVLAVSFVFAEEFQASITKVDGNKVTYQKMKKGKKEGDAVTVELAKDAKILKGTFNKDTKKLEDGDAIEGGLKAEMFSKATEEKGVNATITTDDDKKTITKIVIGGKKKKAAN